MDKKELIHSLPGVKIVIGNGFDLHCGLKTSFFDYFLFRYSDYLFLSKWYELYDETGIFEINGYHKQIHKYNIWDVFFTLIWVNNKNDTNKRWLDIENLILSSLMDQPIIEKRPEKRYLFLLSYIKWPYIKRLFENKEDAPRSEDQFILRFIREIENNSNDIINDFYEFLLEQLKAYEKRFGDFVDWQLHDRYLENLNHSIFLNRKYINNCDITFKQLVSKNLIASIDSFNYSRIEIAPYLDLTHHINGKHDCPIFGVDSIYFSPNDERYIFTKTARRIEADSLDKQADMQRGFSHIVIYGHSLSEADYSYFFPLFDKINLADAQIRKVVVFAFSIFDETKRKQILKELRQSVSNLLTEYAVSKGIATPARFIDSLTTQQKILMFEIQPLANPYRNFLDDNWDKILNNYENSK